MMGYSYKRIGKDNIQFLGVQFRNESPGHIWPIEAEYSADDLVAIRLPSGRTWSGQGKPFRYVAAEMVILKLYTNVEQATPVMRFNLTKKKAVKAT